MAVFDSIVNVEEWISDYYLTTDESKGESFTKRVKARTNQWAKEASLSETPVERLKRVRGALQSAFAQGAPTSALIREAFGYGEPQELTFTRAGEPVEFVGWVGHAGTLVVLEADPVDSVEEVAQASKVVGDIFLSDAPPAFIVIIAGNWVVLAERELWPLGRYLAVDLQLVVERNDTTKSGELARVAVMLAREDIERAADGTTWWTDTLEESRQHAVKVSGDLRDAVRESIELIGNDVLQRRQAQGLPLEDVDGNELARQALRYLYRILFLLFAEASPELGILPTGSPEYVAGYGLDRLRDQILTPPVTEQARHGTHLYESLQVLFDQVNHGHDPFAAADADEDAQNHGLTFRNLDADLFKPEATALIDRTALSNEALTHVLRNLLLSREAAGKDRGFISYATLGVTELGQVYEGLMSYHGFIAQEDLYEVAPKGNAEKGSWVIPVSRSSEVPEDSFVMEDVEDPAGGVFKRRRRYPRGSFVYRQSSRDRERSASFYTPQVLTEFSVSQAVEVLQEEGRISCADDVLTLSICEPAMGSGAFAVEAVRQLAECYLDLKEQELGERVPAEERAVELQKVKAYLALHRVYGVDLNPTAVELAEISLWLDTMTAGLKAPWFGLHLRRGNSLVGALRATFSKEQLNKKAWLKAVPRREYAPGRIHHFLLPSESWGAAADAKDLKKLAAEEQKALKAWRRSMLVKPTGSHAKRLLNLAQRVEFLWSVALAKMQIAESQIRRDIDLWGRDPEPATGVVTREQIERELLHNEEGAYRRLRLVMDAWNALKFWPLNEVLDTELPEWDEWLDTLQDILGKEAESRDEAQMVVGRATTWDELHELETTDLGLSGALSMERILSAHPWIATVRDVADEQGFFHWDLDFAAVFAEGGFDLQVGNPPWVRPRGDLDGLYSELDPWFSLAHKPTQAVKNERRAHWNDDARMRDIVFKGTGDIVATASVLGNVSDYPHLANQQPDLYRAFMERTWSNASQRGVVSLIHPESHFTEKKAAPLRRGAYLRLRRHWQFINELSLFDVHHLVSYGVHAYGPEQETADFIQAAHLYHPCTVEESLQHNGEGPLPGLKDDNYNWDQRPHKDRIQHVNLDALKLWASILGDSEADPLESRMVYTVNTEAAKVLEKLAAQPRIGELGLQFSNGWHETGDKKKGYFDTGWAHPDSWDNVIIQGPHIGVSTPMNKQPNPTLKNNQDWSEIDLEALPSDFTPATAYQPDREKKPTYDSDYTQWEVKGERQSARGFYRVAWRAMAATTGYRTLYPTIFPPGTAHIHGVCSAAKPGDNRATVTTAAVLSSLLSDFQIRVSGIANLYGPAIEHLVRPNEVKNVESLIRIYLRLNCLTEAYAPLWEEIIGEKWTVDTPIRNALERRRAQWEIDRIVAESLGVSEDELEMIYRTQFPVMHRYDQEDLYDTNGRKVPKEVVKEHEKCKGDAQLTEQERTWTHPQSQVEYTFEYPFLTYDQWEHQRVRAKES